MTLHDQKGKIRYNPDGTPMTKVLSPARSKINPVDELYARAAIEQAYNGAISRATAKALHANGIKIGPLGVTPWHKRPRPKHGNLGGNQLGSGLIP